MALTQIIHTSCLACVTTTMDCISSVYLHFFTVSNCLSPLALFAALIDVYKRFQDLLDKRYSGA
jgi:hypothetical protein